MIERMTSLGYGSAAAAPIKLGGEVWGALVAAARAANPFRTGRSAGSRDFAELVAQALANADAYRKLADVTREDRRGDRQRAPPAGAKPARRRAAAACLARAPAPAHQDSAHDKTLRDAEALLAEADDELEQALAELRELARGIHPAFSRRRDFDAALDALADRAPVPVRVTQVPEDRLPEPVEVGDLLPRRRGDDERREVRASDTRQGQRSNDRTASSRSSCTDDGIGGAEPAERHRTRRSRGPDRGARRPAAHREPPRPWHPAQRRDSMRLTARGATSCLMPGRSAAPYLTGCRRLASSIRSAS